MAGSIWKGSISFGLLNIPVNLQKAQEGRELSFSMLDSKDLSKIKYKKVSAKDDKEVPWDRIVKGYEYEPGQYVVVTPEELKAANPKATQAFEIEDFVEFDEIDLMFFEKPYYLVPQKSGIKGYFLLREALKKTNKVAIGKIVIRTKQHLGCIMAKGDYLVLELLRFAHEVLETHEVDYLDNIDIPKFNSRELKMAEDLIEGMTSKWEPDKYNDTYEEDVMVMINNKIQAGEGQLVEHPDVPSEERGNTGALVDLMPLLKKSLEAKKKSRTPTASKKKKKTTKKKAA